MPRYVPHERSVGTVARELIEPIIAMTIIWPPFTRQSRCKVVDGAVSRNSRSPCGRSFISGSLGLSLAHVWRNLLRGEHVDAGFSGWSTGHSIGFAIGRKAPGSNIAGAQGSLCGLGRISLLALFMFAADSKDGDERIKRRRDQGVIWDHHGAGETRPSTIRFVMPTRLEKFSRISRHALYISNTNPSGGFVEWS